MDFQSSGHFWFVRSLVYIILLSSGNTTRNRRHLVLSKYANSVTTSYCNNASHSNNSCHCSNASRSKFNNTRNTTIQAIATIYWLQQYIHCNNTGHCEIHAIATIHLAATIQHFFAKIQGNLSACTVFSYTTLIRFVG